MTQNKANIQQSLGPAGTEKYIEIFGDVITNGGASVSEVVAIQNHKLSTTGPSSGQNLVWDSASNTWKPKTVTGALSPNFPALILRTTTVSGTTPANDYTVGVNDVCLIYNGSTAKIILPILGTTPADQNRMLFIVNNSGGSIPFSTTSGFGPPFSQQSSTGSTCAYGCILIWGQSVVGGYGWFAMGSFN